MMSMTRIRLALYVSMFSYDDLVKSSHVSHALLLFFVIALKINVKIKIVSGSPCGAVAAESKKAQANWVVMDK